MPLGKWPVIGQDNIVQVLQKAIAHQKIASGYLFWGQEYLGKEALGRSFIQALLCEKQDGLYCGKCRFCRQWEKGVYPDYYELALGQEKKNIGIEEVRDVISKISRSSFSGNYKVVLIKDAQSVSLEAYNALLKSLEESKPQTVFLFLAPSLKGIPQTVLSRLVIWRLIPFSQEKMFSYFQSRVKDRDILETVIKIAAGRPYLAKRFLDNPPLLESYQRVVRYFVALLNLSSLEQFCYIEDVLEKKKSFNEKVKVAKSLLDGWLLIFRDLLLLKSGAGEQVTNVFLLSRLKAVGKRYSSSYLVAVLDEINLAKELLEKNINPQLLLENLILKLKI